MNIKANSQFLHKKMLADSSCCTHQVVIGNICGKSHTESPAKFSLQGNIYNILLCIICVYGDTSVYNKQYKKD